MQGSRWLRPVPIRGPSKLGPYGGGTGSWSIKEALRGLKREKWASKWCFGAFYAKRPENCEKRPPNGTLEAFFGWDGCLG